MAPNWDLQGPGGGVTDGPKFVMVRFFCPSVVRQRFCYRLQVVLEPCWCIAEAILVLLRAYLWHSKVVLAPPMLAGRAMTDDR